MKIRSIIAVVALGVTLSACSTMDRYRAISTACQTYAVALNTAATLNAQGKLSPLAKVRINQTIDPAQSVCSGDAPTDDPAALRKVTDAIIAVLEAQK